MKPLSLLLGCFLSLQLFAQKQAKAFVEFKAGASFPVGDYANKDAYKAASGLATTGPQFGFAYYMPVSRAGLVVQAGVQYNPIETASLKNIYATARRLNKKLSLVADAGYFGTAKLTFKNLRQSFSEGLLREQPAERCGHDLYGAVVAEDCGG